MNVIDLMKSRKSVRIYDPAFRISSAEIKALLEQAATAPSSSNLQSWRFMIIQDQEVKKELRAIGNDQEQIETASAVVAVIGNKEMYKDVEAIYSKNVAEGHMNDEIKDLMIQSTMALYPNVPDEARMNIASFDAGLVSMQFMLLAKEKGYDTVTMGGFDKVQFAKRFELADNLFPVVLIAIGKAAGPAYGSSRKSIDEITAII